MFIGAPVSASFGNRYSQCDQFKRHFSVAVSAGAFCGFAMGATATAIANMQAIVGRHGPAPKSVVMVPIVGAFFVDLTNLAVLTVFLLPGFIIRP